MNDENNEIAAAPTDSRSEVRHIRTEQVAERLGVGIRTVRDWRNKTRRLGKLHGPPFITISHRLVVYDESEFDAWVKSHRTG